VTRTSPLIVTAMLLTLLVDSTNKYVVFKSAFFDGTIGESHLAIAMLDTLLPLALIYGAICPEHFSITISFIVNIVALVDIAALPIEHTVAVFTVLRVLTIVLVARSDINLFFPLAFAMFEAFFEFAHVNTS